MINFITAGQESKAEENSDQVKHFKTKTEDKINKEWNKE